MADSTNHAGWKLPKRLANGDQVAIIAPSSPVPKKDLERGCEELRRYNLIPAWGEDLLARTRLVAGSPARRREEWRTAWEDPENRGIFAARGGMGAASLLPLEVSREEDLPPPVFSGYSDLTYLHAILQRQRIVSFYGPMVSLEFAKGSDEDGGYESESFRRQLIDGEPGGLLSPVGAVGVREGRAEGRLAGGCLSLLSTLWGTPEQPDLDGAILLLEDEEELPYRVERFLHHLRRGGAFENLSGVLLGEFPRCEPDRRGGPTVAETIQEFFDDFPGPVVWGFPVGHTLRPMITIPLGCRARLDGNAATLELLEPATL